MNKYFLSLIILILCWNLSCSKHPTKSLNFSITNNPTSLDPAYVTDLHGGKIVSLIYDTLIHFDNHLNLKPGIASHFSSNATSTIFTFTIDKNFKYSDGSQIQIQDIRASFERIVHPKTNSPRSWIFENVLGYQDYRNEKSTNVQGFKILDDDTFQIHLTKPFSSFLSLLTMPNAAITHPTNFRLGTGPFKLAKWQQDHYIELTQNPFSLKKSKIPNIIYFIQPEPITKVSDFELGNIHIMEIPDNEIAYYTSHNSWGPYTHQAPALNTYYLGMNCFKGPLKNVDARKMVRSIINPQVILDTFYNHKAIQAKNPIPPNLFNNPTPIPEQNVSSTPITQTLTLLQSNKSENSIITEVFQSQLKAQNIDLKIISLEWSTFKSKIINGDYDLFYLSWWADYPDAENFLTPLFYSKNHGAGGNYTRINDSILDHLIESIHQEPIGNQRQIYIHQAINRIHDLSPIICLWHKTNYYITRPNIINFVLPPIYTINNELMIEFNHED